MLRLLGLNLPSCQARIREEKRRARIAELTKIGKCWTLENNSAHIDVPLDADGLVARNKGHRGYPARRCCSYLMQWFATGSLDQWCTIHTLAPIPARGQFYCAVKILKLPETTNTWRICFGAVPIGFKVNAERRWVGSQKSWAYIAGTGGKCFDSGKSVDYGDKYGWEPNRTGFGTETHTIFSSRRRHRWPVSRF